MGGKPTLILDTFHSNLRLITHTKRLRLARSYLSRYLRLPNYRNSWLRQGFQEEELSGDGSERLAEGLVAWDPRATYESGYTNISRLAQIKFAFRW